jgi:hypothetical protein
MSYSTETVVNNELQQLQDIAKGVVDALERGPRDSAWKFSPDGGKAQYRELRASVKSAGTAKTVGRGASRKPFNQSDFSDLPLLLSVSASGTIGEMKTGNLILVSRYVYLSFRSTRYISQS